MYCFLIYRNHPNSTFFFSFIYWQASQSGSSKEQAEGTGAGAPSSCCAASVSPELTAFSFHCCTVDFSVDVAAIDLK